MRVIFESIFQRQHLIITKLFITLCKHSSYIYNFNILVIISIVITFILRVNYITWHMKKNKFGPIKWDFKIKQWASGNIVIISQEML